jgi:hypothetical protein
MAVKDLQRVKTFYPDLQWAVEALKDITKSS